MQILHDGTRLTDTNYFGSEDCRSGVAWAFIQSGVWHVLIPSSPIHPPSMVEARPVTDRQEPDGWRWRLELPEWHLPLYSRCIRPRRPSLPEPSTRHERRAIFYHRILHEEDQRGSSFFGTIRPGLQIWASCPLWVVRGKSRQEEKAPRGRDW